MAKTIRVSSIGTLLEKVPTWECFFVNPEKGLFLSVYVDDIMERNKKRRPKVESTCERSRIMASQHHSLTMSIWVALNENAKPAKILLTSSETCLNPGSLQQQKKSYIVQGDPTRKSLHGPMIWKVMQRNVEGYCERANKTPSNCTKLQLHALMTINAKKKNWDLLENCQKYALKLF